MNISPERARELRRRHRHERQAVVFGGRVAAVAVAPLGATAVYTGVVEAPFSREFTTRAVDAPEIVAPPCLPEGTAPVAYGQVEVRVLNGTSAAGLAGEVAADLEARSFAVLGAGNSPTPFTGVAEVLFGEEGVAAAYTVAAQFEGALLLLDTRGGGEVDVVIGNAFTALREPSMVPLEPDEPMASAEGCIPLEEALQSALPPPPGDDEVPTEDQDDPDEPEQTDPSAEG
jgi:hypothetical protein